MSHRPGSLHPRFPLRRRQGAFYLASFLVIGALIAYLTMNRVHPDETAETTASIEPDPPAEIATATAPFVPEIREIVDSFSRNQTLADVLAKHGISDRQIHDLVERTRPIYDLARVASGRPYWLRITGGGELHDFRYPVDDDRYLTVYRDSGSYVPVMKRLPYEVRVEAVSGVIENSLFMAVKEIGEEEELALELADIFMWDIDFYTEIQKGDSFRMLVEKNYLDGRFVKYGTILAADINKEGKTLTGFRFLGEDGTYGYYAADGEALKKSFLKSPLKFARISSGFSRARLHPVLRIVRPHLGVDYAAPTGTPVVAVGAGTVAAAGSQGGSGKMVRLRHAGGYETLYLHLSRIAVRPGSRVAQGQLIGYVGATGLATGPHLDFRVVQHGRYINPAKVVFPPSPPVPASSFARFSALRDEHQSRLDQVAFAQIPAEPQEKD